TDSDVASATFTINIEFPNSPPVVNFISYTGECKLGSTITVQCDVSDPDPADTLTVNGWAGQCDSNTREDTNRCLNSRSWDTRIGTIYYPQDIAQKDVGEPMAAPPIGSVFTKTITIDQPFGTALAATCQAIDNHGWKSAQYSDAYPLCGDCANPPIFTNIRLSDTPERNGQFILSFTQDADSRDLSENPSVALQKIDPITLQVIQSEQAIFDSRSGRSYTYIILKTVAGDWRIAVSGRTELCIGSGYANVNIDYCAGTSPPANRCNLPNDPNTRVYYSQTRRNVADSNGNYGCVYDETRELCYFGCSGGVCTGNTAPSIASLSVDPLKARKGQRVTVTAAAADVDKDLVKLACFRPDDRTQLCQSDDYEATEDGSAELSCAFAAPWEDEQDHAISCYIEDTGRGGEMSADAIAKKIEYAEEIDPIDGILKYRGKKLLPQAGPPGGLGGLGVGELIGHAVATPRISPNGGTFPDSVRVAIKTSPPDADIRYTLDEKDPTISSAIYRDHITIASTATLKAKAFKTGLDDSDVASATFTIKSGGRK
ncbi:MAG: chitobiase/beta-hexosaminidase C-terminal domain-containing protein, partial [Candidatus Aenigmarchaeota archaeon]|nr:chitobiase/beta-hexosaminidase C-terminal domain-containing protein [Candidatus Aenigmarchaeota archaeon]